MRFRTQLLLGGGVLMTLTLLSGILAVITLVTTTNHVNEVTQKLVDDLTAVQTVRVRAEQLVAAARGYLLSGDEPYLEQMREQETELESSLRALRGATTDPEITAQLATVEATIRGYSSATKTAVRDHTARDSLQTLEVAFEHQVEPHRTALDAAVNALVALERGNVQDETQHAGSVIRNFAIVLLAIWSVGFVVCVVFGVIVLRKLNRQYERIESAEAAAREAASSRKQILDIVAHDLLNPLNAIVLGAESMQLQGLDARQVAPIARSASRMHRLINDLIDVSRAEHLTFNLVRTEHRAVDILESTAEQFRARAVATNVALVTDCPPSVCADVDRDRIVQVLSNFVGNAMRVMKSGGTVTLRASQNAGCVRFSVEDTGPGIAPESIPHLFDAYRKGAARGGSLGIGLFISKALVEAHGGTIGVDSKLGAGSTFWFEIPGAVTR